LNSPKRRRGPRTATLAGEVEARRLGRLRVAGLLAGGEPLPLLYRRDTRERPPGEAELGVPALPFPSEPRDGRGREVEAKEGGRARFPPSRASSRPSSASGRSSRSCAAASVARRGRGRCNPLRVRKTGGISVELRGVALPPIITRSEVTWVVFILAGIAFVVGAAVLIGAALAALPFIWGMVVAFAVVVLVAALVAVELRRLWAAATIRAFVSATALDNGQRLPGK
jgi:hypothetical protein